METKRITIHVAPEAARLYASSSAARRRKLDALLSVWLSEAIQPNRPLDAIMRDASEQARRNGLTPEMLKNLLDE